MDSVTKHRLVLAVRKSGFFQVNRVKQSVSLYFLLLALLPHQQYLVTGNSMCASLSFDMEHHEQFHSIQSKATVTSLLLCLHECYTFRHLYIHTYYI